MNIVNIREAKTNLSRLVEEVAGGVEIVKRLLSQGGIVYCLFLTIMNYKRVFVRGQPWHVESEAHLGVRTLFRLRDPDCGDHLEVLCPPEEFEPLIESAPSLDRKSLTPFGIWRSLHEALRLQLPGEGRYAAFNAGRISPEPYVNGNDGRPCRHRQGGGRPELAML